MSLPSGSQNWICCPGCGEIEDIWRLGKVGVSEGEQGKRRRTHDSRRFKCHFCGIQFNSDGATRRECMGYDPHLKSPITQSISRS